MFPGWYRLSPQERGALTRYASFSFDTNVLLNLYNMAPGTRRSLLDILHKLSDKSRLWLPHQVALEFHRRRPGKSLEQLRPSRKIQEALDKAHESIRKEIEANAEHPFLEKSEALERISTVRDEVAAELREMEDEFSLHLDHDEIRDELDELFADVIGLEYSTERTEEIYKAGQKRYKRQIPPGFADAKSNGGDKEEPDCYGDLVIWNQLLDYSREQGKSIVFVSEDHKKGDWFWRAKPREKGSRILGPRPELVQEMFEKSGKRFHLVRTTRFTNWISRSLGSLVSKEAITEIEKVSNLPTWSELVSEQAQLNLRLLQETVADLGSSSIASTYLETIRRSLQDPGLRDVLRDASNQAVQQVAQLNSETRKLLEAMGNSRYGSLSTPSDNPNLSQAPAQSAGEDDG